MNNFVSHYGLVDARISTSDKDLPVQHLVDLQILQHILTIFKIPGFSTNLEVPVK